MQPAPPRAADPAISGCRALQRWCPCGQL